MKTLLLTCALAAAGCFAPEYHSGNLRCAAVEPRCPDGLHCAGDGTCWRDGEDPSEVDQGGSDGATQPDLLPALNANGESCTLSSSCASNHCTDGVCCDSACTGQCQACDVSGALGTCTAVSGPPHAARSACVGFGTPCGGTCNGVAVASCTYPPASTICGAACDGQCNGAGTCSSSGGACPNGFACGTGSCKTTCSGQADCQANFMCNAPNCVRITESDCLDGLDNNGDGLIDCADPTCINTRVVCAPPTTVPGYVATTCPIGFGSTHINQGFQSPNTCHGCGCTANGSCSFAFYGDNSGNGCVNPNFLLGTITSAGLCFSIGAPAQYYSIRAVDTPSATCVNAQTGVPDTTGYSTSRNFCQTPKSSNATGCTGGQICVAKPSPAQAVCALVTGASCPTGYQGSSSSWNGDGTSSDNRSCSCSGCSVTNNGSCGVGGLSWIVHTPSNSAPLCTDSPAPYMYCGGGCCPWNAPGTNTDGYWARFSNINGMSAHALPSNSGATCAGGTGTVSSGSATPGTQYSVCCP